MPNLDIPAAPFLQPMPLQLVDIHIEPGLEEAPPPWAPPPGPGVPVTEGAFINHGLLTPPPTPPLLPQAEPNVPGPLVLWIHNVQAEPDVLELANIDLGNENDDPFWNLNNQLLDPIDIGGHQEPGPVAFEGDLAFNELHAISSWNEDEAGDMFLHKEDDEHADDDILVGPSFGEISEEPDEDDTEAHEDMEVNEVDEQF